jgi:DNA-binding protein H-NS
MLKEQLVERLAKLRQKRQELVAQRQAELARIDEQITNTQGLIENWDVFTIEEALAALAKTGIRLRLDS